MSNHFEKTFFSTDYHIRYLDAKGSEIDTKVSYKKRSTCERWIKEKESSKRNKKRYFIVPVQVKMTTFITEKNFK